MVPPVPDNYLKVYQLTVDKRGKKHPKKVLCCLFQAEGCAPVWKCRCLSGNLPQKGCGGFFCLFVSPPPNFIPLERILFSPVLALFRGDPTINAY